MRWIGLIIDLVTHAVIGSLATLPVMIVMLLFNALTEAREHWIPNLGAGVGALVAVAKFMGFTAARAPTTHGSAVFGTDDLARKALGHAHGLILGRAQRGWLMRYDGPGHLITLAPTRSGKGVGAVIPNLLTVDRAVICIDPKGENARITARARSRFGPVHVLDPFGVTGLQSAAFNPLSGLDPFGVDVAEDAAMIAEALVHDPPNQIGEAHWNEEAKALIAGLILHVVATEAAASLAKVREILTWPEAKFTAELVKMQKSSAVGGLIARAANRHLGKSEREASGVLSSAQRHTHFLDSPRMTAVLAGSDFSFHDLKRATATIYLVLPPERLATHARWLRLLVALALNNLARPSHGVAASPSVLFLLDEFAALGRLEPVERGFGLMAGYGVQLWAILQDIHQLKGLYGDKAGTFLANAGAIQVFNVADIETASWVSRMLGVGTEVYATSGTSSSHSVTQPFGTFGESTTPHHVARALMTPDEVLQMDANRLLLLRPGRPRWRPGKSATSPMLSSRGCSMPDLRTTPTDTCSCALQPLPTQATSA